jgi:hypothetical protein
MNDVLVRFRDSDPVAATASARKEAIAMPEPRRRAA